MCIKGQIVDLIVTNHGFYCTASDVTIKVLNKCFVTLIIDMRL